jgi:leucine dehydrogenase
MTPEPQLLSRRGERSGLQIAIAVHSTELGPALGGCRMWRYGDPEEGIADAHRLAAAMTLKAAAAGLELGGGKGVICVADELSPERRCAALLDFADAVDSLDGAYITAEDVGTCAEDMAVVAQRTEHVVGLPPRLGGAGDPSPLTARGVERAIRACVEHRYGGTDLAGLEVAIVGLGHVGTELAQRLRDAGASLLAADIDPRRESVAKSLGARWLDPDDAMLASCDVLAPCALGGSVDEANVSALRCEILCGAANNVLAEESLAPALARRGVLYAPDFIANAGGLIHVYGDLRGHDPALVEELVDSIGETVSTVLADAEEAGITPLEAAHDLAQHRLEAGAPARAA